MAVWQVWLSGRCHKEGPVSRSGPSQSQIGLQASSSTTNNGPLGLNPLLATKCAFGRASFVPSNTGPPNAKISIAPAEGGENLVWHLLRGERKFASSRWRGAKICFAPLARRENLKPALSGERNRHNSYIFLRAPLCGASQCTHSTACVRRLVSPGPNSNTARDKHGKARLRARTDSVLRPLGLAGL